MSEQKPLDKVASFLGIEVIKNRMNTYSKEDNFLTLEELELYRKKFLEKEPIFDNKHFIGSILEQPEHQYLKKLYENQNLSEFLKVAREKLSAPIFGFFRALLFFKKDQLLNSMQILEGMLQQEYYHHDVFSLQAAIYKKQGNHQDEEENIILAILCNPNHPLLFSKYAMFLIEQEDKERAKILLKNCLQRDPSLEMIAVILGSLQREEIIDKLKETEAKLKPQYRYNSKAHMRSLNYANRGIWLNSFSMRMGISAVINALKPESICILGAGNCNNFDIAQLSQVCKKVKLVDLDKYALGYAKRIQKLDELKNIVYKFNVDFTSIYDDMYFWSSKCPPAEEIEKAIQKMTDTPFDFQPIYELTISDCVLQSVLFVFDSKLGSQHPYFKDLITAFLEKHIQQLFDNTKEGGFALFITEVLSSENNEFLRDTRFIKGEYREIDLMDHQDKMLAYANPSAMQEFILNNNNLAQQVNSVNLTNFWIWHYPGINYLVSGIAIEKK